jgi:hypothetical protein
MPKESRDLEVENLGQGLKQPAATKCSSTETGFRYPPVMPSKAGIQAFLMDSRQKRARMTP